MLAACIDNAAYPRSLVSLVLWRRRGRFAANEDSVLVLEQDDDSDAVEQLDQFRAGSEGKSAVA